MDSTTELKPLKLTGEEIIRNGDRHLAELIQRQHVNADSAGIRQARRTRAAGRKLVLWGVWIQLAASSTRRWLSSPQHWPGRAKAHVYLFRPTRTFSLWAFGFALLTGLTGLLILRPRVFWPTLSDTHVAELRTGLGVFFGSAAIGLTVLLWTELVRCPYVLSRIRRRIRKMPDSTLLTNIGARKADVVPRNDPLEIVPREEFFYDVLPGVLARDRKDVQIVVGAPGAGKTTALLDLAGLLARIGIVPVLIPLRSERVPPSERVIHLVDLAHGRFCKQVEEFVRSQAEAEVLWSWLRRRRRLALLADDIDQIGPDGERGFVLRQTLLEAATYGFPIIASARPAGVPAGIAASAISLNALDEDTVIEKVIGGAQQDPGFRPSYAVPRQQLEDWIREGNLVEVPFYLELLAQLVAAGECPELPDARSLSAEAPRSGRYRLRPDGHFEWNPLWVRFRLLEVFEDKARSGQVRPWLGIGALERRSSLNQLRRAALGSLAATGIATSGERLGRSEQGRELAGPQRRRIEDFISSDDRKESTGGGKENTSTEDDDRSTVLGRKRKQVSVHEVTDTGERLRVLDRDSDGNLQFRHRIMQAYLAGCCLAERLQKNPSALKRGPSGWNPKPENEPSEPNWIEWLIDPHHPEKLTAHMTLTFAALFADRMHDLDEGENRGEGKQERWKDIGQKIVWYLVTAAKRELSDPVGQQTTHPSGPVVGDSGTGDRRAQEATDSDDLDPRHYVDPDARKDPDDALIKLTTAADVSRAIQCPIIDQRDDCPATQENIVDAVEKVEMATRWTKIDAIRAVASLDAQKRWECIWSFACDPDYAVRRAAGDAMQADATRAYRALENEIHTLILGAAARSAFSFDLTRPECHSGTGPWSKKDILRLRSLGWVLPSVISGLREDPSMHAPHGWHGRHDGSRDGSGRPGQERPGADTEPISDNEFSNYTSRARAALEQLVALSFEGGHHDLEESLAQGFKGDAMLHAAGMSKSDAAPRIAGPGWVASNRRLVADMGLRQAESWCARIWLYQALAMYTISGADERSALDVFDHYLHRRKGDRHPFTRRAARLARTGVRRHLIGSDRWNACIWADESEIGTRRATRLDHGVAQLVADITLLLDLREGSSEDSRRSFGYMEELPYCLTQSRDRSEILGTGCPDDKCGWGLCPYKQAPPDEPNAQRGVSKAFCRQQRQIASHHMRRCTPPWHRRIRKGKLQDFWREMEQRART